MVHVAGLVIGTLNPLSQGASVVILPRFQPEQFLAALQNYEVDQCETDRFTSTVKPL